MSSKNNIKYAIENLSQEKQIIFCIHIAKRLWPNYINFYKTEVFGDILFLDQILDLIKKYLQNDLSKSVLNLKKEELIRIAPDSEEYPGLLSTHALDACAACDDLLSLVIANDKEAAIRASELAINTIFLSVVAKLNLTQYSEELIYNSNEMNKELSFQEALLKYITDKRFEELLNEAMDIEY